MKDPSKEDFKHAVWIFCAMSGALCAFRCTEQVVLGTKFVSQDMTINLHNSMRNITSRVFVAVKQTRKLRLATIRGTKNFRNISVCSSISSISRVSKNC
jgi:hypothetical protein